MKRNNNYELPNITNNSTQIETPNKQKYLNYLNTTLSLYRLHRNG